MRRVARGLYDGNVFFHAGGLAFSILLALVPFLLLLITGIAFLFGRDPTAAASTIISLTDALLPSEAFEAGALLRTVVDDILRTRQAVGLGAAIGFVWTATRLFGAMRSVLSITLEHEDRSIVKGKLFDVVAALAALVFVAIYLTLVTYVGVATEQGAALLARIGVHIEDLGWVSYLSGRLLAILVLVAGLYALYRWLPRERPASGSALTAALCAGLLFEIARHVFGVVVTRVGVASLYAGTIAVIVSVVFWTYYAAILFVVGAEVLQAAELRREELRRLRADLPPPRGAAAG